MIGASLFPPRRPSQRGEFKRWFRFFCCLARYLCRVYTNPGCRSRSCARTSRSCLSRLICRKLLKKLEPEKSLVQKQLNAILHPVLRLPLEISSEIFIQSLPPSHPEPGAHHVPMLLLNVCNAWTTIALSTPTLWAGIHIVFPCARGLKEVLPTWLHRAQRRPLSISLEGKMERGVADVIWEHGQLKNLQICDR